jgi:hypothetical protein
MRCSQVVPDLGAPHTKKTFTLESVRESKLL